MSLNQGFIETLKKWKGEEVDIFLVSGAKLNDVTLSVIDKEKIIVEAKRVKYLVPPKNLDYVKKI